MELTPPPQTGKEPFDEWMNLLYRWLSNMSKIECEYIEMKELSASPAAPGTDRVRIYAIDSGGAKTQLTARFNTGVVQVIKTEP
jgi:hypothetical protein